MWKVFVSSSPAIKRVLYCSLQSYASIIVFPTFCEQYNSDFGFDLILNFESIATVAICILPKVKQEHIVRKK